MKKLIGVALLAATLFTASCKKETDAQLLAKRLQDVIRTEHVERVLYSESTVGDPSNWTIYGDYGKAYSFDPPLVKIENHVYSLTSLKTYEVVTISGYQCLVLIF